MAPKETLTFRLFFLPSMGRWTTLSHWFCIFREMPETSLPRMMATFSLRFQARKSTLLFLFNSRATISNPSFFNFSKIGEILLECSQSTVFSALSAVLDSLG